MTLNIKPEEIFRDGVTLLAFVMAFYALIARERKTPYMVYNVYSITFIILWALAFAITSSVFDVQWLKYFSVAILGVGTVYVYFRVWTEQNRHLYFRNDHLFRNLSIPRLYIWTKYLVQKKPKYEHNAKEFPPALFESLKSLSVFGNGQIEEMLKHHEGIVDMSFSAAFEIPSLIQTDSILTRVAAAFLEHECYVQYTCCSRHPTEFLSQLKHFWQTQSHENLTWKAISQRVVLVDAYTRHFGFTDSIYPKRKRQFAADCLNIVDSKATFAGVHTAIAQAFNCIKRVDADGLRTPTLVIYDGCHALADVESEEQYRIFLRHVVPSERLFGGMFTIFAETSIKESDEVVLRSTVDVFVKVAANELQTADL